MGKKTELVLSSPACLIRESQWFSRFCGFIQSNVGVHIYASTCELVICPSFMVNKRIHFSWTSLHSKLNIKQSSAGLCPSSVSLFPLTPQRGRMTSSEG